VDVAEFLSQFRRIGIDTNVLISVFAEESVGKNVVPLIDAVGNKRTHEFVASVLTFAECAVLPYREGNWAALDQVKLMFQMPNLMVYPMDEIVAEEAARIRGVYNLRMPDAIIAATAIVHKADVLLTNDHELGIIKEIQVVKPGDLHT
jgi:predicted nucleic acid-binding protein